MNHETDNNIYYNYWKMKMIISNDSVYYLLDYSLLARNVKGKAEIVDKTVYIYFYDCITKFLHSLPLLRGVQRENSKWIWLLIFRDFEWKLVTIIKDPNLKLQKYNYN